MSTTVDSKVPGSSVKAAPAMSSAELQAHHRKGIALADAFRKAEKRVNAEFAERTGSSMSKDGPWALAIGKVRTERYDTLLAWAAQMSGTSDTVNYRGIVNPLTGQNTHWFPSRIIDNVAGADAAQIKSIRAYNRKNQ